MEIKAEDLKTELKKSYSGDIDTIMVDQPLSNDVDSLDLMDFYMNVEEKFDVHIPDEEIDKLKTLNDFKDYLEKSIS